MLTARYSSGSSGSAPCAVCAASSACLASKASEMYLRKISPRTTCLYSAASILLRSASAAAQSLASKPRLAPLPLFFVLEACFGVFAIVPPPHHSGAVIGDSPSGCDYCGNSSRFRQASENVTISATFFLTSVPISVTGGQSRSSNYRGTLLETIPEAERGRCPRAGLVTPHSGGFGTPPGRHYDRSARSSLQRD